MAKFDVAGAKAAGYSDDEIRQFIASLPETAKAKESGYSDTEIFDYFGVPVGLRICPHCLGLKRINKPDKYGRAVSVRVVCPTCNGHGYK